MKSVDSGRLTRTFTQRIAAPPARVFPLLCPVRESEWLDGWRDEVELIHSDSGLAEHGCVFRTRVPGRPETIWVITRHDPAARIVEFARVTPGLLATQLTLRVEDAPDQSSRVEIRYTFTPLGPAGRQFVMDTHSEAAFQADMVEWEDSMNHWLRTGTLLRLPARQTPSTSAALEPADPRP